MPDNPRGENQVAQELPQHYTYLYKFRVEQCPLFLQHKCTQRRPYTCFHWHFQNQRRRKPVIHKGGQLNYSADEYCAKYDETTGKSPQLQHNNHSWSTFSLYLCKCHALTLKHCFLIRDLLGRGRLHIPPPYSWRH